MEFTWFPTDFPLFRIYEKYNYVIVLLAYLSFLIAYFCSYSTKCVSSRLLDLTSGCLLWLVYKYDSHVGERHKRKIKGIGRSSKIPRELSVYIGDNCNIIIIWVAAHSHDTWTAHFCMLIILASFLVGWPMQHNASPYSRNTKTTGV